MLLFRPLPVFAIDNYIGSHTYGFGFASSVPDYPEFEASGMTYNPLTRTFFVVNGNSKNPDIFELEVDATRVTVKRRIPTQGFIYPEAITWMSGETFAIADEYDGRLVILNINEDTTEIEKNMWPSYLITELGGGETREGIEGLVYLPKTGIFYAIKEKNPKAIYKIAFHVKGFSVTVPFAAEDIPLGDISGLAYLPRISPNDLLVLSDENRRILGISLFGNPSQPTGNIYIGGTGLSSPEGIAVDPAGNIYVMSENDAGGPIFAHYYPRNPIINTSPVADLGDVGESIDIVDDGDGFESITLYGNNSRDDDGVIIDYYWGVDGVLQKEDFGPRVGSFTQSFVAGSTHVVSLMVRDDLWSTNVTSVRVNVFPKPNDPPRAEATVPTIVTADERYAESATVLVDASQSVDPEGQPLRYLWEETALGVLLDTTTAITTLSLPIGSHHLSLTVFDIEEASDTISSDIDIVLPPNQSPIARAQVPTLVVTDTRGDTSARFPVDANASEDPEGKALRYVWEEENLGILLDTTTALSEIQLPTGNHSVSLTVFDIEEASDTISFSIDIVQPPNQPPVANALVPSIMRADSRDAVNVRVPVNASHSHDPEGGAIRFVWEESELGVLLDTTTAINDLILPIGSHELTLTVFDVEGASDTIPFQIYVILPPNQSPVAQAEVPSVVVTNTRQDTTASFQVNASQSQDPEGENLRFVWEEEELGILLDTTTAITTLTLPVGFHTLSLTVFDIEGASNTISIGININRPANQSPVAIASVPKQIVTENRDAMEAIFQVDAGNSRDPEEETLRFVWEKTGLGVLIDTTTTLVTLTLPIGSHQLSLTVFDVEGASNTIHFNVDIVLPPNQVPTSQAEVPSLVKTNTREDTSATFQVDASQSQDPEGKALRYVWETVELGVLLDTTTAITTLSLPIGSHRLSLTVFDVEGASSPVSFDINIALPANLPPLSRAEVPSLVTTNSRQETSAHFQVDASQSEDPEGTALRYVWEEKNLGVLLDTTTVTPILTLPIGSHQLKLIVYDVEEASDTSSYNIDIVLPANQSPIANASVPTFVVAENSDAVNALVPVDASQSQDPEGGNLRFVWENEELGILLDTTTAVTSLTLPIGAHQLSLTVFDIENASQTITFAVTVILPEPANLPPVARAVVPTEVVTQSKAADGALFFVDASESYDPEGEPLRYLWQEETLGPINGTTIATATLSLPIGNHILTLTVFDVKWASASATFPITIRNPENQLPVAEAGPNKTVEDTDGDGFERIQMDASQSNDPDGTILEYTWFKVESPLSVRELSRSPLAVVDLPPLVVGDHDLLLMVIDDDGATSSDTVKVTINAAPQKEDPFEDLSLNYLHPDGAKTAIITYKMKIAGSVTIKIYDQRSQLVTELNSGYKEAGPNKTTWDTRKRKKEKKSVSGIYLIHLDGPVEEKFQRIIISR
ncbi:hypothetical protein BVX98_02095 [bacterium F11]|nr:hypothetical protein BVX98_02095 [bacterium F11]